MGIILASASPRRRELLRQMGLENFRVVPARGEERAEPGLAPAELVEVLSARKAREVSARFPGELVIAADTVVALDGRILGKPRDEGEAAGMLASLSGRTHLVCTGLTVRRDGEETVCHESARVWFRPLTDAEIAAYLRTGEPMDKAGAYGIQGCGALLAERIEGDYFTVVGLPVCRLGRILAQFGVDALALAAGRSKRSS